MGNTKRDKQGTTKRPPLWVRLVLRVGDFVMRRFFPRFVTGMQHYTASPATVVISNHRRDADGPLLASVLLRRHHGRLIGPWPHFVAREDLFDRGFLAHYLSRWPARLRALLTTISLGGFLMRCGAYPLPRTHERNIADVLQNVIDLAGDMPVRQALRPGRMHAVAVKLGTNLVTTRSAALVRSHGRELQRMRYGYRHLRLDIFRQIKPSLQASVERQLACFVDLLDHGHMVILEPEGRLSLDGGLRRPRAALFEFIDRSRANVHVLPMAVTYDTLTTGRTRIFVDIQPELVDLRGLPRHAVDRRCMAALRSGCRVTAGQLAAGFWLLHADTAANWSAAAMTAHIHAAADKCRAAGLALDPCLSNRHDCETRTADILTWGVCAGLLRHDNDHDYRIIDPDMPPPWLPDGPASLLGYLREELLYTVGEKLALDLGLLP